MKATIEIFLTCELTCERRSRNESPGESIIKITPKTGVVGNTKRTSSSRQKNVPLGRHNIARPSQLFLPARAGSAVANKSAKAVGEWKGGFQGSAQEVTGGGKSFVPEPGLCRKAQCTSSPSSGRKFKKPSCPPPVSLSKGPTAS